jgi:predicted RNase H-like nuclease (RuvC/YqgF family)
VADWADHAITGLLSGSFVAAVIGGLVTWSNARHKQQRENRADEVGVLHQTIAEFRVDRDRDKEEMARQGKDLGELKDNYTACLLNCERVKQENLYLRRDNRELTERIQALEGQVKDLQRKSNPEM